MTNQIQTIITDNQLSDSSAQVMQKAFTGYFEQAKQLAEESKSIVVTSEDQTELIKQAREKRLELKDIRVEVEKTRKQMKEESLRTGKAIDGMANIIKFLIVPVEEHLQLQEDFIKIREEKRKAVLAEKRLSELLKFDINSDGYDLANMGEESYQQLLDNSRLAFEARKAVEKKAEQDRIEAEKKRLEEEKRIREENARLKQEAEERERKMAIERKKQQEAQSKIAKQLEKEKVARDKAEAEVKARQEAERIAKAKAEQEEKEAELARLKAEKEARLAPDKEKMRSVYKKIKDLSTNLRSNYIFQSQEVQDIINSVLDDINRQLAIIEQKMKGL